MLCLLMLTIASCRTRDGFACERSVEATISDAPDKAMKLNVALGDVVSLELPENVSLRGQPALGNSAVFDVKVVSDPLRILVWPKQPQRDEGDPTLLGERSNLQIFLDGGITLALELRIALAEKSVQLVRFRFPERERESAYVRDKITEESRRLEAEFQGRRTALEREIGDLTRERLARGMLVHADCRALRGRKMHDLVVLRTHRICRIGGDLFLTFSIQNRSRDTFALERADIRGDGSESVVEGVRTTFEGQLVLSFDQTLRGVVAWPVDEESESVADWTLTAVERAGRQRVVRLEGVGF